MTAAIDFIHGALFKIGAHSEIKPVSSEMLNFSFGKLQGFIKNLLDEGYDEIGFIVPGALPDELGERGGVTHHLETLFAKFISPYFRLPVTPELLMESSRAEQSLWRHYNTQEIPNVRQGSPVIFGAGNRRSSRVNKI